MKDVKGYEGLYAVTSCGRVWSYRRKKFLKPSIDKWGYLRVNLYKNKEQKHKFIHQLVAEAYIPNPNNLPMVNHKDEVKTHNWINNLEWCDVTYNNNYGTRNAKIAKKVRCVETGEVFESLTIAAKTFGISIGGISQVCNGKAKTSGGYHWIFVE